MAEEAQLRHGSQPCVDLPRSVAEDDGRDRIHDRVFVAAPAYAALDLGTNNCRLLVARVAPEGFRVIDSFSRIIRLGEGVSTTGRISDAAISRAVGALTVCSDKIRARGVKRLRTIATEACRAAENSDSFLSVIAQETGIQLEIVDRETESTLAMIGCSPLLDSKAKGAILFDIGGGSTEIVRIERTGGAADAAPVKGPWVSLPLGVVTLAERFGGTNVTRQCYEAMIEAVAGHLAPFADRYGNDLCGMHLLGTSGTVTTVAGVHLGLPHYDRRKVDGLWMNDGELDSAIERLLAMTYRDRALNPCIGTERADLVLAGCAILDAIRLAFPLPRLRVADRGLREGMLVEMMRKDGVMPAA
ncbi:Ppx/GppA phosphatase family protein [Bradyrhizobium sp. SYSU BS000235]|uniref:Ppx/GppA phosphatase family protein n=1 Tax=Bradyrhizobium sp. SYSU BS000235 TaxID=3411332 RepID=UPI003C72D280